MKKAALAAMLLAFLASLAYAGEQNVSFEALKGRWLRPDGGYVIEIKNVSAGGVMDAAYFNPRPINIDKAVAKKENGAIKVFIKLRDVGYPGSTYDLVYDVKKDLLIGAYYQAAIRQTYDIYFKRIK
jgi:hypothetical protein